MEHNSAILLIDFQNDYLPSGAFELENTDEVIKNTLQIIEYTKKKQIPIFHIQHIADPNLGLAPFFNIDTPGVEIINVIMKAAPDSQIIVKHYADSFEQTSLDDHLKQLGIRELYLAGMMTQNCVTHTALSLKAIEYKINVISDACTTVNFLLHQIALHALSSRVNITDSATFLAK
ncbi:cysteine hydrolase family protein [Thorsellia kenyensis]|uniref:Cysteine hydrolase family protein n=1 Tax=Thorsellia kenyensis TaxID=1549888 RepID=A0ABV6CBH7_9GAMM